MTSTRAKPAVQVKEDLPFLSAHHIVSLVSMPVAIVQHAATPASALPTVRAAEVASLAWLLDRFAGPAVKLQARLAAIKPHENRRFMTSACESSMHRTQRVRCSLQTLLYVLSYVLIRVS